MMDIRKIDAELERIVHAAEKLDFPLFSSFEKKQAVVEQEREAINRQIEALLREGNIEFADLEQKRTSLWKTADLDARAEFGPLSEKEMLNGFYLQEVMHRYAEAWVKIIREILGIRQ